MSIANRAATVKLVNCCLIKWFMSALSSGENRNNDVSSYLFHSNKSVWCWHSYRVTITNITGRTSANNSSTPISKFFELRNNHQMEMYLDYEDYFHHTLDISVHYVSSMFSLMVYNMDLLLDSDQGLGIHRRV